MAALYALLKAQRQLAAPHGIPVSTLFFGHDPALKDYKEAHKIKTLEVHPVLPWVVTADEAGNTTIWDYNAECVVISFAADSLKDGQRSAVQALDAHNDFAASNDVAVPDAAGPGLGIGLGCEPGAVAGSGTEAFISAVAGGVSKKRTATSGLNEDARSGKTGGVRMVRWADEHVLAWSCGSGRGDYEGTDVHGNVSQSQRGAIPPLAPTLDDLCATMAGCTDTTAAHAGRNGNTPVSALYAPHQWLLVLCEYRVLILDYATCAVIDVPHASLLIEASGPAGLQRTVSRGKPSVIAASLIGPGVIAFGCEDGVVRIWAADASAVIQTVRLHSASGKAITHVHTVCTSPHAVPGTTGAVSQVSALGAVQKEVRTLLIVGAADGVVAVFEIVGGRMLVDSGRGGAQSLKIPGDLSDLSVGAITAHAVALGSDKSVTVWDASARPVTGAAPRLAQSRISTSSAAAEGGVGSRLMAAVTMGSHPALPPSTMLVAGKGPHLELAIAGSAEKGPGAESGIIFYDLRTARPGLPSKLKIYTLSRHPFRPEIVAAGTNIGVFVLAIAPQYTAGALCVTHPSWRLPARVCDEQFPCAEGARVSEGALAVHVNVHGMLVASDVRVATPACEEDEEAGIAPSCPLPRGPGGGLPRVTGKAAAAGPSGLDISSIDHVLLSALAPAMPPPSTMAPADKNGPAPPHNAVSQLLAILKGSPVPGSRGVRLRLSGSGRYLAAVWPDHKYYAVYRLVMPTLGDKEQAAGRHCEGDSGSESVTQSEAAAWGAEYVDGGTGLDVAWSGHTVGSFEDRYGQPGPVGGDKASPGAPIARRFDRFVVLEPGQLLSGRGPMGGGMAIGSAPQAKGGKAGAADGDSKAAKSEGPTKIATTPATLSLRQLPVLDDPSTEQGKVLVIAADLALAQGLEPTGIAGGPLLAVCTMNESGFSTIFPAQHLAQSSLQLLTWTVIDPDPAVVAEAEKVSAESRYSGATKAKGARHKMALAGGSGSMPAPSLAALASGCGVLWNSECTRLSVATPFHVHIFAHFSPRRLAASSLDGAKGEGSGPKISTGTIVELCRVPLQAVSACWTGATLVVSTTDARVVSVCAPIIDPHIIAELVAAAVGSGGVTGNPSNIGLSGTVASVLVVNGSRLSPVVVDLQSLALPPSLPAAIHSTALPVSARGLAHVSCCAPLFMARGHIVLLHWTGSRAGGSTAGATSTGGAGAGGVQITAVNVGHPGLRACMAAAWAGCSDYRSSQATFLHANKWAAQWGARLHSSAHTSLARYLADLGALPAALMLPGLSAGAGVALACAKKGDVYVRAHVRSKGRSWSAVETRVAVAYLLHLMRTAEDGALLALAGSSSSTFGPDLGDVACAGSVEGETNVLGAWPQVAAFLSLAAATYADGAQPQVAAGAGSEDDGPLDASRIRAALVAFSYRLSTLRLTGDALMVASVLHRSGVSVPAMRQAAAVARRDTAPEGEGEGSGRGAARGATRNTGVLPPSSAELLLQVLIEGRGWGRDLAHASMQGLA